MQQEQLNTIINSVKKIEKDVELMRPKTGFKKIRNNLFTGILRGFGFVVGTTIFAGIIFSVIYYFLSSTGLSEFLGQTINQAITNAIQESIVF